MRRKDIPLRSSQFTRSGFHRVQGFFIERGGTRLRAAPSRPRRGDFGCFSEDLLQILRPMSQHPSLKGKGAIKAKRSVLKRFERVELMKKRGQFKEGQRVIGLPKTKPED